MEFNLRPSLRKSEEEHRLERERQNLPVLSKEEQEYENQRDLDILKKMWFFVVFGITVFVGGFGIWALDNQYCSTLRQWRRSIGMPWGFVLEGHGWWHLMTGLGAYCYILWAIHLRHILNGDQEHFRLVWDKIYHLPEVVRVSEPPAKANGRLANGGANGSSKKSN